MAGWQDAWWTGAVGAPGRADRRSGSYRTYCPDLLSGRVLPLEREVSDLAWRAENEVRRLGERPGSRGLEALARFLLRSEAIASSRIEGLRVSPQQVGLAELAAEEGLPSRVVTETARLVAANIAAVRHATADLATSDAIGVADVERLQEILLTGRDDLLRLRTVQNWVGGNDHHPLDAEFVPPEPRQVAPLMTDLTTYLNGGEHAALVQAGLVHAQFETIHPFKDGNGRVGRALIHTVLVRRGLTRSAVLPISLVLLTRSQEYVAALTAYRHDGAATSQTARAGTSAWLRLFLQSARTAAEQAAGLADQLDRLRDAWSAQLAGARRARGLRSAPRVDSATARLLDTLQETPVLTSATVTRLLGVSDVAAKQALEELAEAEVLTRRSVGGRAQVYRCSDVFDLVTPTERRLASTRWDTAASPPARDVPSAPRP